jgi:hypothetical protein
LAAVGAVQPAEQYKRELMVSHFARHRFAREQRAVVNISNKKIGWCSFITILVVPINTLH